MDYSAVFRDATTGWLKDSKTLKYLAMYLGVTIVFLLLIIGIGLFFFSGVVSQFMQLSEQQAAGAQMNPDEALSVLSLFLQNFIPFILLLVPLLVIYMLVMYYIQLLINTRALEVLGIRAEPMTPIKALKAILLSIWVSIMVLTSWYNRPFFLAFLGIIVLSVLGLVFAFLIPALAPLFVIVLVLLFIVYFFVVIYNEIRLSLSLQLFISKNSGILATARESWEMTKGRAVEILIAFVVVGLLIFGINFVLWIATLVLTFGLGFITSDWVVQQGASTLVSLLFAPVLLAIQLSGIASIYKQVSKS